MGMHMYQAGDRIIYGSNGACVIEEIKMMEVPHTDEKKAYYIIKPCYQECRISAPVDTRVFMRPIISADEARSLIDGIPRVDAQPYYNNVLRQLQEYYDTKINSHSCADLVELTVSLYRKKVIMQEQKRKFGAIDERYLKRAEDLLFGELAVALEIQKNEVRQFIAARLAE